MVIRGLVVFISFLLLLASPFETQPQAEKAAQPAQDQRMSIGGEPAITLQRPRSQGSDTPQFLSVQVLPGRAMNLFQIVAYFPGLGKINLISSPSLQEAKKVLDGT